LGGAGADNTSGLAFGGEFATVRRNLTESWNGTCFSEVNDLNTARKQLGGNGIQTSALAMGGDTPPSTAVTESWNGTCWTEVNDLNTARAFLSATGTQTASLAFGGGPPAVGNTESWNGTSWTEENDLSTARFQVTSGGSQTAGLAAGGQLGGGSVSAATEEWTKPSFTVKTITSS